MAIEDCSITLIFSSMLSSLKRKERRARRMLKLLCSVSYYIRLDHRADVKIVKKGIGTDKYVKVFYKSLASIHKTNRRYVK
jgi:hypothetical protein